MSIFSSPCLTSLLPCSPFIPTRHITSLRYARVSFSFTTPRSGRRAEPEVRRVAREQREREKRPPRVEHGGRRAGWGDDDVTRTVPHLLHYRCLSVIITLPFPGVFVLPSVTSSAPFIHLLIPSGRTRPLGRDRKEKGMR